MPGTEFSTGQHLWFLGVNMGRLKARLTDYNGRTDKQRAKDLKYRLSRTWQKHPRWFQDLAIVLAPTIYKETMKNCHESFDFKKQNDNELQKIEKEIKSNKLARAIKRVKTKTPKIRPLLRSGFEDNANIDNEPSIESQIKPITENDVFFIRSELGDRSNTSEIIEPEEHEYVDWFDKKNQSDVMTKKIVDDLIN